MAFSKVRDRFGWPLGGVLFLSLLWIQFISVLMPTWLSLPTYRYGLLAVPLSLYLIWRRCAEAEGSKEGTGTGKSTVGLGVFLGLALLLLIPLRVVESVDGYWRFPLWLHAAIVYLSTLLVLAHLRGWRWCWFVFPPIALLLVTIPLPSTMENALMGRLTEQVSQMVAWMLPYAGYPINRLGNAMAVKGQLLDVSEGCSGIRSFQSCFMAALYLGEFYRLSWSRRVVLLLGCLLFAIVGNSGRVFSLTTIAYDQGFEAEAKAHDSVGYTTLIAIYGFSALLAWLLAHFPKTKSRVVTRQVEC